MSDAAFLKLRPLLAAQLLAQWSPGNLLRSLMPAEVLPQLMCHLVGTLLPRGAISHVSPTEAASAVSTLTVALQRETDVGSLSDALPNLRCLRVASYSPSALGHIPEALPELESLEFSIAQPPPAPRGGVPGKTSVPSSPLAFVVRFEVLRSLIIDSPAGPLSSTAVMEALTPLAETLEVLVLPTITNHPTSVKVEFPNLCAVSLMSRVNGLSLKGSRYLEKLAAPELPSLHPGVYIRSLRLRAMDDWNAADALSELPHPGALTALDAPMGGDRVVGFLATSNTNGAAATSVTMAHAAGRQLEDHADPAAERAAAEERTAAFCPWPAVGTLRRLRIAWKHEEPAAKLLREIIFPAAVSLTHVTIPADRDMFDTVAALPSLAVLNVRCEIGNRFNRGTDNATLVRGMQRITAPTLRTLCVTGTDFVSMTAVELYDILRGKALTNLSFASPRNGNFGSRFHAGEMLTQPQDNQLPLASVRINTALTEVQARKQAQSAKSVYETFRFLPLLHATLRMLDLHQHNIEDDDLPSLLSALPQLTALDLGDTNVSNLSCDRLAAAPKLCFLKVSGLLGQFGSLPTRLAEKGRMLELENPFTKPPATFFGDDDTLDSG